MFVVPLHCSAAAVLQRTSEDRIVCVSGLAAELRCVLMLHNVLSEPQLEWSLSQKSSLSFQKLLFISAFILIVPHTGNV